VALGRGVQDYRVVRREPVIDGNCKGLPLGACAGATKRSDEPDTEGDDFALPHAILN
jgi:hypothetical protein